MIDRQLTVALTIVACLFGGSACDDAFVASSDAGGGGTATTSAGGTSAGGASAGGASAGGASAGGASAGGASSGGGGQGGAVAPPICEANCSLNTFYKLGVNTPDFAGGLVVTTTTIFYSDLNESLYSIPKAPPHNGLGHAGGPGLRQLVGDGSVVWWATHPQGACNAVNGIANTINGSSPIACGSSTDDPDELSFLAVGPAQVCAGGGQPPAVYCYPKNGGTGTKVFAGAATYEVRGLAIHGGYAYFTVAKPTPGQDTGLYRVELVGNAPVEFVQVDGADIVPESLHTAGDRLWWAGAAPPLANVSGELRSYHPGSMTFTETTQRAAHLSVAEPWIYLDDGLGNALAVRSDGFGSPVSLGSAPIDTLNLAADLSDPTRIFFITNDEIHTLQ